MVIVVPAFAEGEKSHPPAVSGQIRAVKISVPEGVSSRIHQPGDVLNDHESQRDRPENES